MTLQIDGIVSMLLIFTRAGALFLAVPVLGGMSVPVEIRVGLGMLISIILLPVVPAATVALAPGAVVTAVIFELIVGLLMAWLCKRSLQRSTLPPSSFRARSA